MLNQKKIIILNGISKDFNGKGIVKIEVFDGYLIARTEILCLDKISENTLTLTLGIDGKILSVTVEKKAIFECKINKNLDISQGISAVILQKNEPILYGETKNSPFKLNDLLTKNTENLESEEDYDDYQLATENYYKNVLFTKNDGEYESGKTEEKEQEKHVDFNENEENLRTQKSQEFYLKHKDKLDEIFSKYEPFYGLNTIIPNGKFARVDYNKNYHYIVGIICENEIVKYVCYGVPKISEAPPKNLEKYCKFIPTTQDFKSGYYLVFQSANSGNLV